MLTRQFIHFQHKIVELKSCKSMNEENEIFMVFGGEKKVE